MSWYDITLEGFTVNTQTWDHMLNVDGWADEVYINADVRVIDNAGSTLLQSVTHSDIMGDTNTFPFRVRAGSGNTGGLMTGDQYPYPDPWVRKTELQANHPPMRLWQGELTDDRAVKVTPTLWEWDGGSDIFNSWGQSLVNNGPSIAQAVVNLIGLWQGVAPNAGDAIKTNLDLGLPALYTLLNDIVGQAKDRPIGQVKQGNAYSFNPISLVMTDIIANLATQNDFGKGPGLIVLNYVDDATIGAGSYDLYVKVAKVIVPLSDGSLVRERSSALVYVIYGGARFWIPDPNWLTRYGGWGAVIVVPDGSLANVPTTPSNGTVLREWSSASVYVMLNGQKCWIRTLDMLDKYTNNLRWSQVRVVPDGGLAMIPQGPDAP